MNTTGYREEVLNVLLAQLLDERGIVSESVKRATQTRRVPDVLALIRGLRTAIEGKVDDHPTAADDVLKDARGRLEQGIAHIGIAVLHPATLRQIPFASVKSELSKTKLRIAICSEAGEQVWTDGGTNYLGAMLRRTSDQLIEEDIVTQAVAALDAGVEAFPQAFGASPAAIERSAEVLGSYEPHEHEARLKSSLPTTGFCEFVFVCDMGDISFCSDEYLERIAKRMRQESDRTFLVQSKNPATFSRVKWPRNVVLGTTIETNRDDLCAAISTAPPPSQRFADLLAIEHAVKMVTIEPVMDFDLDTLASWVEQIHPRMVWLGYQNHGKDLPAPPMEKVRELHWRLSQLHIPVVLKSVPTVEQDG